MDLKAVVPHVIKVRPAAVKSVSVTPSTSGAPVVLAVTPGAPGDPGAPGKSAYQLAVDGGFSGTESEWLASLKGADGKDGKDGSGGGGGVSAVALPPGLMQLRGGWNASTNTPTLSKSSELDLALFGFSVTSPTRIAVDSALTLYVCDGDQLKTLNLNNAASDTVPFVDVTDVIGLSLADGSVYVAASLSGAPAVVKWDGVAQTTIPFTGVDAIRDVAVADDDTVWIIAIVSGAKALLKWDGTTQTSVSIPTALQGGAWNALCALPGGSVCVDGEYVVHGETVTAGGSTVVAVAMTSDDRYIYAALGSGGLAKISLDASSSVSLTPGTHSNYTGMAFAAGGGLLFYAADNHVYMLTGVSNPGDVYRVTETGTQDLGDGPVSWSVGDYVIADGNKFHKLSG